MERPAFIDGLLEPSAYPSGERPQRVELEETHVSWLFFTGDFVYKVKKPVDLGFLDFSTLELRHIYCQEEFRLNRRLSPGVYLGVSEVRRRNGSFNIDGGGRMIDYAVKMRQLPRDRWLRRLLESGEADAPMVERIARRIADFHNRAATDDTITRIGGIDTIRFNTRENSDQTRNYVGTTLSAVQFDTVSAYLDAFLNTRHLLFAERAAEGRVRDCHGDLHADQICVDNGIEFIDCIEFNYRFRFSDVAADIAFLVMDLEHFGRPDLAAACIASYVARSGDKRLRALLDFYKCYRAYTRGKVMSFRLDQERLDGTERADIVGEARSYFDLAFRYARLPRPLLLITRGLMGSGKSALAHALAPRLSAKVLSSDALRKQLAGIEPEERHFEPWAHGIYAPQFTERTYAHMHERAAELLASGRSVILDASYREPANRDAARKLAEEAGASFLIAETRSPRHILEQRLAARHLPDEPEDDLARQPTPPSIQASRAADGRVELLEKQFRAFLAAGSAKHPERLLIDTSGPRAETVRRTLARIYEMLLAPNGKNCVLGG